MRSTAAARDWALLAVEAEPATVALHGVLTIRGRLGRCLRLLELALLAGVGGVDRDVVHSTHLSRQGSVSFTNKPVNLEREELDLGDRHDQLAVELVDERYRCALRIGQAVPVCRR